MKKIILILLTLFVIGCGTLVIKGKLEVKSSNGHIYNCVPTSKISQFDKYVICDIKMDVGKLRCTIDLTKKIFDIENDCFILVESENIF